MIKCYSFCVDKAFFFFFNLLGRQIQTQTILKTKYVWVDKIHKNGCSVLKVHLFQVILDLMFKHKELQELGNRSRVSDEVVTLSLLNYVNATLKFLHMIYVRITKILQLL